MNGDLAIPERSELALVIIHKNDVMPQVGKAGACHQPYVSGTHHSDPHFQIPLVK